MAHGHRWLLGSAVVLALAAALALIVAGGGASLAAGDIIYVDAGATGTPDGETWATAYTDLQVALGAAVSGKQIWVAEGTYKPTDGADRTVSFQMVNGVEIYGGFDPSVGDTEWEDRDWANNATILSGDIGTPDDASDNSYHVVYSSGASETAVLNGFTITGGNANDASSPHWDGGGMYNHTSSPTLANLIFSENLGDHGAGLYNQDSSPTLTNCTFTGNEATVHNGGGMYNNNSSPTLTNCTFARNSATTVGGGMYSNNSSPTLTNCILWEDSPDEIYDESSTSLVTYSDIQDGYSGEGNKDEDPLFVDAGDGDLRLQLTSPCVDAGDNGAPGLADVTTDLGGNPRFAGVVDMGAYEAPPDVIHVDVEATGTNDGTSWADAFTDLQDALAWAVSGVEIWVAEGTYKPSVEHGGSGDRYRSLQMVNGVAIYGGFDPSVGDDAWEERDWEANETTLSGDTGTPDEPSDNSYHVFYHPSESVLDSTAILDGFTITGGNANGASWPHYYGGGMYNDGSSPTLTNVTFYGNSAEYGGGMYNDESFPTLANCRFYDNRAYGGGGGGMVNDYSSSPTLTSCTFYGNSADWYGGGMLNGWFSEPTLTNSIFTGNSATYGGGMLNFDYSSPTLTNCTFSGNSATTGGGGMLNDYSSSPTLTNCILWGDTADTGPEICNVDSAPVVTYSDIQGGYPGETNIDDDPLFVNADNGDLHLRPGSPCIDTGDNYASYLPAYDFEGHPRIMDGDRDGAPTVDMGADEVFGYRVHLPLVLKNY